MRLMNEAKPDILKLSPITRVAAFFFILACAAGLPYAIWTGDWIDAVMFLIVLFTLVPPVLFGRLPPAWLSTEEEQRQMYEDPLKLETSSESKPFLAGAATGAVVGGLVVYSLMST